LQEKADRIRTQPARGGGAHEWSTNAKATRFYSPF